MQERDSYIDPEEKYLNLLKSLFQESINSQNIIDLISECTEDNVYLTCKCIIYARKHGNRHNSLYASMLINNFISGQEYAKDFYGLQGVIIRPDDMHTILAFNQGKLSNSMKKGFRVAIESYTTEELLFNRKHLVDVINLVRPRSFESMAIIKIDDQECYTLDVIMKDLYNSVTPEYDPKAIPDLNKVKQINL